MSSACPQAVHLIDAHQLNSELGRYQLVDARPRLVYDQGHIPGAAWIGWEEWCASPPDSTPVVVHQPGYWGSLKDESPAWYESRLSALGLEERSPVVVYADGPASRGREGRVAWMLLYLGASQVGLLDGGWRAWIEAGGKTTVGPSRVQNASFKMRIQPSRRLTLDEVRSRLNEPSTALVDTRSREEFLGNGQDYLERRGRLPSAVCFPYTELFETDGRYIDARTYKEKLLVLVNESCQLVSYCEVGVRAALLAVLHEVYTGEIMSVYDGSFVEWSLNEEMNVVLAENELMRRRSGSARA